MGNLLQFMSGGGDGQPAPLQELRLGAEPAMVIPFTTDTVDVTMHFVDDASVNSYVVCPGKGCPVCHLGSAPIATMLLPLYEIGSRTIRVLRIPMRRQPGSLATCLVPHLVPGKTVGRLLAITRNGPKYAVVAHAVAPKGDHGEEVVRDFLARLQSGLRMESAFKILTSEELADVPAVANKLASLGTWVPPAPEVVSDQESQS